MRLWRIKVEQIVAKIKGEIAGELTIQSPVVRQSVSTASLSNDLKECDEI
jgi:hypothetical protein